MFIKVLTALILAAYLYIHVHTTYMYMYMYKYQTIISFIHLHVHVCNTVMCISRSKEDVQYNNYMYSTFPSAACKRPLHFVAFSLLVKS